MIFPAFAILGLFTSLSPQFIISTLGVDNLLLVGAATFVLFEAGVIAQLLLLNRPYRWAILYGLGLLIASLLLIAVGLVLTSFIVLAAGAIIGGFGAGLGFMGGLGMLSDGIASDSRAGTTAAYFVAAQSGVAVPVLMIGALSPPGTHGRDDDGDYGDCCAGRYRLCHQPAREALI